MSNSRRFRRQVQQATLGPVGQRVVYSAGCMWWDTIDKAAVTASGLPCTPCCGAPLKEVPSERKWWETVRRHEEQADDPGYRLFIEWLRGRHFPDLETAKAAYRKANEDAVRELDKERT